MSIYSQDFPLLTHLQRKTLQMLAEGLSNYEIAMQHKVSEKAVEQVISRVAHTFQISPDHSHNMRVLLTLAFLTRLKEINS